MWTHDVLEDRPCVRVQHGLEPRLRRQRPCALEAAGDSALGGAGAQLAVETARLQQLHKYTDRQSGGTEDKSRLW